MAALCSTVSFMANTDADSYEVQCGMRRRRSTSGMKSLGNQSETSHDFLYQPPKWL
jgi:hypothetical protein